MVEVVIDSVRVSLTNQQRIVVLREVNAERYLPIWIGPYEAEAITIALQEIEVARPQTHDLLKNTISRLGARLVRVQVVSLREDVFYGELIVEQEDDQFSIDCRPSDALALAVRCHVPILIAREILDSAAISQAARCNAELGIPYRFLNGIADCLQLVFRSRPAGNIVFTVPDRISKAGDIVSGA